MLRYDMHIAMAVVKRAIRTNSACPRQFPHARITLIILPGCGVFFISMAIAAQSILPSD